MLEPQLRSCVWYMEPRNSLPESHLKLTSRSTILVPEDISTWQQRHLPLSYIDCADLPRGQVTFCYNVGCAAIIGKRAFPKLSHYRLPLLLKAHNDPQSGSSQQISHWDMRWSIRHRVGVVNILHFVCWRWIQEITEMLRPPKAVLGFRDQQASQYWSNIECGCAGLFLCFRQYMKFDQQ